MRSETHNHVRSPCRQRRTVETVQAIETAGSPIRIGSFALAILVLSVGLAAAAPPAPQDCNDSDHSARIKCKFGNILTQQEATATMLADMPEIPDNRKLDLMRATERCMGAHGRSASSDFKQLMKKKDSACQVAEFNGDSKGNNDGTCEPGEDCLEVLGDQIGDDIQPCKTTGKPSEREVCVEICDSEAIDSNPDNFDEAGRGLDIEEELDDATGQYVELNEMLEDGMTLRAAGRILAANGDPCGTVLADRLSSAGLWVSLYAKLLVEGLTDIHDKFCNQDLSGFNGAVSCAIIEGIKALAVIQFETLDNIDGNRDSDAIDTTLECLKTVNASVGESNAALGSIETKVDSLDQQVKTLQQQLVDVMNLLVTPQGRRDDFPSKN